MKPRLALYHRLAAWWPLLSDPAEYEEESRFYRDVILSHAAIEPETLLELGSGGGNNASHLKRRFRMTLVDLSPRMLAVSRELNPECAHARGDMRTVRLGRQFDAVLIQDAIVYMATRADLSRAVATAFAHCRPGGVALFSPDWTRDRFAPSTSHGGYDRGDRGLRYLEWTIDHDPGDERYSMYLSYVTREGRRVRHSGLDEHVCGLFAEETWLTIIRDAGFLPKMLPFEHSDLEEGKHVLFVGIRNRA